MVHFFSVYPKILPTWAAVRTKVGWGVGRKAHYSHQTEPGMARGNLGWKGGLGSF